MRSLLPCLLLLGSFPVGDVQAARGAAAVFARLIKSDCLKRAIHSLLMIRTGQNLGDRPAADFPNKLITIGRVGDHRGDGAITVSVIALGLVSLNGQCMRRF